MNLRAALPALLLVLAVLHSPGAAYNSLGRDREPVVLTGAELAELLGADPGHIVAFRYEEGWVQIPVQVDERAVVDFGTVYGTAPTGYTFETYTDAGTFTGPDPDPTFDSDDEMVFMAGDAGASSAAGPPEPAGTLPGTGIEIRVTHPVLTISAYVYLFVSDGTLDPGAGTSYVQYDFDLLSGPYLTTYNTMSGPNPEDTWVTSDAYGVHFSDRWVRDETRVHRDGATGVDILDRHRNLFAPGNCTRSEDTFSAGEGALIVNRGGPVRVLRGYCGANSGPTTNRIHAFYAEQEVILTDLRVHAISGILDIFDYSPDAAGMTYSNDLNTAGVTVDGVPDVVTPGELAWELVSGQQGALSHVSSIVTDIPDFTYTSYYSDDVTPPETQCTGDDYEYGASGAWVDHDIPNTDPGAAGYPYNLDAWRHVAYGPPGATEQFATGYRSEIAAPLLIATAPYVPTGVASGPQESRLAELAANPAGDAMSLVLRLDARESARVSLYDVSGRLADRFPVSAGAAGERDVSRPLTDLASGVYLVRIDTSAGRREDHRLVVIR